MDTVKEMIPANIRKIAYIVFAIIGVGFGATQTAFVTAEVSAPLWLTVAFQVYLYIGGAFGLVAATNTSSNKELPAEEDVSFEPQETSNESFTVDLGKHGEL